MKKKNNHIPRKEERRLCVENGGHKWIRKEKKKIISMKCSQCGFAFTNQIERV